MANTEDDLSEKTMELCREVIDGLSLLKTNKISGQQMTEVLRQSKQLLLNKSTDGSDEDVLNTIEEKLLKLSVCSLIVELVKHNTGSDAIESVLEEYGLKSSADNKFNDNCLQLIQFYRSVRQEIRHKLLDQTFGEPLPAVIDAQWEQYYLLRAEGREKINEIQYLIKINCDKSVVNEETDIAKGSHDLTFTASLPQMQDLCHKLRECRKCVEKVLK